MIVFMLRVFEDDKPPPALPPEPDGWVYYKNEVERKKTNREVDSWPQPLRDVADKLDDFALSLPMARVIKGLGRDISGHGAGLHVTEAGGRLGVHLDYALHPATLMERRFNAVLFLTPDWEPRFGGHLNFHDDEGRKILARFLPTYGCAVFWESSDTAYHSVSPVAEGAPDRITLAAYYVAPPRPGCSRKRALFVPERG